MKKADFVNNKILFKKLLFAPIIRIDTLNVEDVMVMKINNIGPSGVNPYKRQMAKQESISKQVNQGTDKVEISSTAKEMQQISQFAAARKEKVEQIKISVENGTYKANPQDIAKSIANYYLKDLRKE